MWLTGQKNNQLRSFKCHCREGWAQKLASIFCLYFLSKKGWSVGERVSGWGQGHTSSIALMRFWVDLFISPAAGIPLPGVKKAVLGPG